MTGKRGKSSPNHTARNDDTPDIAKLMVDGTAIDQAIQDAAIDAIIFHMRLNNPVAVWENGKVVWKDAKELLAGYGTNSSRSPLKKSGRKKKRTH